MKKPFGKVFLVGAGPGDPGLLTVRGAECLRQADVVVYDYLAAPELLGHAKAGAELVCVGRHGRGHGRLLTQVEINAALVEHALRGRKVVRLKGGDPALFARLAEELASLEAAEVEYEIIPGVTAASAASSYAGVPLTDRHEASCVAFVTGRERADKCHEASSLDFAALAKFPGTLVFYMGITTANDWSRELMANGMASQTPVAIVRRASLADQETAVTTLGELPELLRAQKIRPPAVIIVGNVVRERAAASWFASLPLFGRTVLVTRPEHQADSLAARLRELGARVLFQPAIEIAPPADWSAVDAAISQLDEVNWLVFSSANGVRFFLNRLIEQGDDARQLGGTRLAAIGPATALALAGYHLKADVYPSEYRAEALAEALKPHVAGQRVLLVRASRGRKVLAEVLLATGAQVEQVVAYESRDVLEPEPEIVAALMGGQVDYVTVTSPAIARSLIRMLGAALEKTQLVAISPLTAEALAEQGTLAACVAEVFTSEGVVAAILGLAASISGQVKVSGSRPTNA
ncbi:MAG: uroporphyrinogen-III C-methyltransferase [Pirellulales bacterium]|nr:uroporphyrinogen-III C-methyltransferase [Pirellulales bacterium]